MHSRKLLS